MDKMEQEWQWSITNCTAECSSSIPLSESILKSKNELFVPARILPYARYELKFTLMAYEFPTSPISKTTYIRIDPSGITANLVPLGTSMITHGHRQSLTMKPGEYSVDPNTNSFNKTVSQENFYVEISTIIIIFSSYYKISHTYG